jgi:hypothetical protein
MSDARIQGSSAGSKPPRKSKGSTTKTAQAAGAESGRETKTADVGVVSLSPVDRGAMIATAAYFRAERRNFESGHEIEDWLAAEAEVDAALLEGLKK